MRKNGTCKVMSAAGATMAILGLLSLIICAAAPARAATYTVTKLDDTNDGLCDADCSLREAITTANAGSGADTIDFAPGLTGVIILTSALPNLVYPMTITGPGRDNLAVSGNNLYRIFYLSPGSNLTISGLTLSNGFSSSAGGAMYAYANTAPVTLTVTDCTIRDNHSANYGGAISGWYSTVISLTNCIISGNSNTTTYGGGAIYQSTGSQATGTLMATDCTFKNNGGVGGGGHGGAIMTSGPTVNLAGCTFSTNSAKGNGGAIYFLGSSALTLTNCSLSGNSASSGGGAISTNTSASVSLSNCTLSGNSAASGGAINHAGTGTLRLTDSTLSGNSSTSSASALIGSNGTPMEANNCVFSGNSAGGNGAVFVYSNGSMTMTGCTISGNTTTNGVGGVFSYGSLTMSNCTINNNTGTNGGGITSTGALRLTNCTIRDNSGGSGTGGVYSYANAPLHTTLANCTISGNSGGGNGGGFLKYNSSAILTNCTISGNSVTGGSSRGGGINNQSASLTVANCTISGNSATVSGGGIYKLTSTSAVLNLRNCIVAGNSAPTNPDLEGALTTDDHNLIGGTAAAAGLEVDAGGHPLLKDNGGPTQTVALLAGSPAMEAANPAIFEPTDQRGVTRPQDGDGNGTALPDIGAYEQLDPTLVELTDFKAAPSAGMVTLSWQTATEIDTAGFHLWRSKKKNRGYVRITDRLIHAAGDCLLPASYSYGDFDVTFGATYFYKLEDLDMRGVSTFHGPASATVGEIIPVSPESGAAVPRRPSPTFTWESAPFDRFKLEISRSAGFEDSVLILPLLKPGASRQAQWIRHRSYTPTRDDWKRIKSMQEEGGTLYWRVKGTNRPGNGFTSKPYVLKIAR